MISSAMSSYALERKAAGAPIDLAAPKEGVFAMPSGVAVVKGSPQADLAFAYVDMLLGAELQQRLVGPTLLAADQPGRCRARRACLRISCVHQIDWGPCRPRARRLDQAGDRDRWRLRHAMANPSMSDPGFLAISGAGKATARARCSAASTSRSPAASSSPCSAPPGAERRPCCASSPASSPRSRPRVVLYGRDITRNPPHRRDVGVVFQN